MRLLRTLLARRASFDSAFSSLVRKYSIGKAEARELYKLFYKVVIYYHSIKFVSAYSGFKPHLSGIVEYIYTKRFDMNRVLEDIVELSKSVSTATRIALLYGYPLWYVRDLYNKLPLSELESMLSSLNERKRWLRVNIAKTNIEGAIECLEKSGLRVKQHETFKEMLLVEDKYAKVGGNICVRKGLVVPQDISSYISASALRHVRGDIVDACSAPGVKLVQVLTEATTNRALAVDVSEKRVNVLFNLVRWFLGNRPNVIIIHGDSKVLEYNLRGAIALVDAPCSNSGAIYSDPAIKLHLSKRALKRFHAVQKALLKNSLKSMSRVFFMTCSVHPLEGEELIDYLVKSYDGKVHLSQITLPYPYLDKGYPGYTCSSRVYRIYPHKVNGQGVFMAVIEVNGFE